MGDGINTREDVAKDNNGFLGGLFLDSGAVYQGTDGQYYKNDSGLFDFGTTDSMVKFGKTGNTVIDTGKNWGLSNLFGTKNSSGKGSTSGGFLGGLGSIAGIGGNLFNIYSGMQQISMAKDTMKENQKRYDYNKGLAATELKEFKDQRKNITNSYNA